MRLLRFDRKIKTLKNVISLMHGRIGYFVGLKREKVALAIAL